MEELLFALEEDAKVQVEVSSNKGIKCFCVQVRGVQLVSLPSAFMIDFRPSAPSELLPRVQSECQGHPLFEVT